MVSGKIIFIFVFFCSTYRFYSFIMLVFLFIFWLSQELFFMASFDGDYAPITPCLTQTAAQATMQTLLFRLFHPSSSLILLFIHPSLHLFSSSLILLFTHPPVHSSFSSFIHPPFIHPPLIYLLFSHIFDSFFFIRPHFSFIHSSSFIP